MSLPVKARVSASLAVALIRPGGKIVDFKTTVTTPNEPQVEHRNQLQPTELPFAFHQVRGPHLLDYICKSRLETPACHCL